MTMTTAAGTMVLLTERAARKVRSLLAANADTAGFGLRVDVDPVGGSYQYSLALAPEPAPDDVVIGQDGFDVYVHGDVAPLLNGVRIDYVESLATSGFAFTNPNTIDAVRDGDPFTAGAAAERDADDAALLTRIEEVMTASVRPFLRREGGDVVVVHVTGGVVSVRLTGVCGGCALASGTVTGIIERRLKAALPEVRRVVQV